MINGKSVIAIVPARAGSKGLPKKNIRELCGKPVIAWTIEAGLASEYIDVVVVSTDSEDIAKIAGEFGATTPFIRPAELATDEATSFDVVKHVLDFYKHELNRIFDYTVLLEPTSPLRDSVDIDRALEKLAETSHAESIVGIAKTEGQNPIFLVKIQENASLIGFIDGRMKTVRRQEIEDIYFFEGSIYISETPALLEKKTFYHEETIGFLFPKWKSLEIDDEDDFIMIEALMAKKIGGR
jgi:N-acylneuraminate cytidylyltransferase/CMP-N,N'-diacetyllegionaminic acid synthase